MRIQELGINSITMIQILVEIEKVFDIEISDENLDYSQYQSISDIIDMVKGCIIT